MLYRLDNRITDDTLDGLINVVKELQPLEDLHIYLRGEGGEIGPAEAIINILDNLSETNNITLYAYDFIISSHFQIFFKSKVQNKVILANAHGMIHKESWEISIVEGAGFKSNHKFMKDYIAIRETLPELKALVKLTPEETKMYKNNEDVWVLNDRLHEMLAYNKKKTLKKEIKIVYENNKI